jgi:hypothetical protein
MAAGIGTISNRDLGRLDAHEGHKSCKRLSTMILINTENRVTIPAFGRESLMDKEKRELGRADSGCGFIVSAAASSDRGLNDVTNLLASACRGASRARLPRLSSNAPTGTL